MKIRDLTAMALHFEESGSSRLRMLFNTDKPSLNETELKEFIAQLEDFYRLLVMQNQEKRFQSE